MSTQSTTHRSDTGTDTGTDQASRGLPWWAPWVSALAVAVVVIGTGSWIVATQDDTGTMDDTTAMGTAADTPEGMPPVVTGYYEDQPIDFIHTETSDDDVAQMLTDMMDGSPVIHTPALAKASSDMLGQVYVFTNGIQPDGPRGPLGYQPDVFDTVPGDPGYSALRSVHLVTWSSGAAPHALTSAADVTQAERAGDVAVSTPGVVVNMPITAWPGGSR